MRSGGFADMTTSRFEVFNVETGESVKGFPFSEHSPRTRSLALVRAKQLALAYTFRPLAVRLWEKGNPVPTIVYSPA